MSVRERLGSVLAIIRESVGMAEHNEPMGIQTFGMNEQIQDS